MRRKVAVRPILLALLVLLAACTDFPFLAQLTPWSTIYSTAQDERKVADLAKDKAIAAQIKVALLNQDGELGLKVKVFCYQRRVTLLGRIGDAGFKALALATAWETDGVRAVATHWETPTEADTTMADLAIMGLLRAALVADEELSSTQIETEVYGGNVYLLGLVRSQMDADRAVARAGTVRGVSAVTSFLVTPARPAAQTH